MTQRQVIQTIAAPGFFRAFPHRGTWWVLLLIGSVAQ
jgi:hypothetical protein